MKIDRNLKTPLYIQLYENIKSDIENNKLKSGDKLPSIRSLSKNLDVNNITIVNAYKLLEQEEYVYSIRGSGTYVKPSNTEINIESIENGTMHLMSDGILSLNKENINLSSATPDPNLFPVDRFKEAIIEVLDRDKGYAFNYPEINGYEPFRESIQEFLSDNYKIKLDRKYIQVISGGQQGIDIITKALLTPGDCILVEDPTYLGAVSAFKSRGAKVIGIPMKEDGIDINLLESAIKKYSPKAVYVMTNFQSPTTYSYSQTTKEKLIELANTYTFYIIEDDFLTDIYFNKMNLPLKSMDSQDRVIYVKSFSKSFMPGVRIGFMTMPKKLFSSIIRTKHSTDISSSGFLQRAFDLYLRKGYWKDYVKKINDIYSKNYNIMVEKLKIFKKYNISFTEPNGGLSIWVRLPENIDSIKLYEECERNNLSITPGRVFFVEENQNKNYIRLSFSNSKPKDIEKGMDILEKSILSILKSNNTKFIPFI